MSDTQKSLILGTYPPKNLRMAAATLEPSCVRYEHRRPHQQVRRPNGRFILNVISPFARLADIRKRNEFKINNRVPYIELFGSIFQRTHSWADN